MEVNIILANDEILETDISRGTYEYIKSKLDTKNSVLSECVKSIEIVK